MPDGSGPVFAQQVRVPNLINLSSIEAFRALKNQGLYMKQGQITPTGQRELTDKVYKQYTRPGALVNKGADSKGRLVHLRHQAVQAQDRHPKEKGAHPL